MYRIAVVSSDPFLRALLCDSLERTGAEVVSYGDWSERTVAGLAGCDMVVMLASYPLLSGLDLAARLRRRGSGRPRIYVLSWLHNEQNVLSVLESGADQYLTLPVNIPRLCGKIAAQIQEWRNGRSD